MNEIVSSTRKQAPNRMLSGSVFARYAHQSRFHKALSLVASRSPVKVLDYGTGNGFFVSLLKEYGIVSACGFDPYSEEQDVLKRLEDIEGQFDCISCLEVLEHLNAEQTTEFFEFVSSRLAPGGFVVVSVPVMIGPVGAGKVVKEMFGADFLNKDKYTIHAALRALIGMPEVKRYKNTLGIYRHLNFDYRHLEARLRSEFSKVKRCASPFGLLPPGLNSQVFYVCEKVS